MFAGTPTCVGARLSAPISDPSGQDLERAVGPDALGGEIWALDREGSGEWVSSDGDALHFGPVSTANGVVYSADMNGS
jgi:hypothetical protein